MRLLAPNLVLSAILLAACSSLDPAPIYFGLSYQLRCGDGQQNCADNPPRTVNVISGEAFYTLQCNATRQNGKRQLSFSAVYKNPASPVDDHEFRVRQAQIDEKTDPGDLCQVSVVDGGNTYQTLDKGCTSGTPTADKPCQLTFKLKGSTVTGTVYCKQIPTLGAPDNKRYLVAPATMDQPIAFELDGCTGL